MASKKHLVVLSGAGISAESGIPTFRGADGLWEGHDITEVASPEGWHKNPSLVLNFYNLRRRAAANAFPNRGHEILAELEDFYDVTVITQNVDDLHERAGSTNVLHLHGMLRLARSTSNPSLIYEIEGTELNMGDTCDEGSQLRPHIVWFGEMVPAMEEAAQIASKADYFIIVGTSLMVYPAAMLIDYVPVHIPKFIVDPNMPAIQDYPQLFKYSLSGSEGLALVKERLLSL
jgi:NAD-dependent deacetylase